MKMVLCFDNETKEELLRNGYKYFGKRDVSGRTAYVFFNNGNKLNFEKNKVMFTNILHF